MKATDIYDFLAHRGKRRGCLLAAATAVMLSLALTLHFSENVSDFLPLGTAQREHLEIYQNISGADRIIVLFSNPGNEQMTCGAVDCFVENLQKSDTRHWCESLTWQFGTADLMEVSDFIYAGIPYFLVEEDYRRIDSLMRNPLFIRERLEQDKKILMMPTSPLVSSAISKDPLQLFTPVMERLRSSGGGMNFSMEEGGYIFTRDKSRAIVMMTSPFGSSETENNSKLMKLLEEAACRARLEYPSVQTDITGGPAIAVGNSSAIKTDSLIAVTLSATLIIILLIFAFRSARNIILIFLSVGWGLLFALGGMSLLSDKVSIIVIGISSVILGIAVNYPLHLIAHTSHQSDRRSALREIISPLVIGNITTVGAFAALIPLKSTALRDLGVFASLLLVGTMLFVIVFLPHYIEIKPRKEYKFRLFDTLSRVRPERHTAITVSAVLITLILSFFSFRTGFDSNMSNINYMTDRQKADMQYFEDLMTNDDEHSAVSLFAYSCGKSSDEALSAKGALCATIDSLEQKGLASRQSAASSFLVSKEVQAQRISLWKKFVATHSSSLTDGFDEIAKEVGFSGKAFADFRATIDRTDSLRAENAAFFAPLCETVFSRNVTSTSKNRHYFVDALNVSPSCLETVKQALGPHCFDVSAMNGDLTRSLSDNFNYIGWACSLIVFIFLWFSFGRIELAIISFLPMAISWIWILGLMSILGIKFNIVNVILATFIFGQGDDYTIFMTEGCQWEYSRNRPILSSYKKSILESAAIMFVGIGTLIVAKHPALRSLAEVTIIGMFSVVLMAYLIPPLLMGWLTVDRNGMPRKLPLTLRTIFCGSPREAARIVRNRYAYRGKEIERQVKRTLSELPASVTGLDLSGEDSYECTDHGYGETALLLALKNPGATIIAHCPDDEHRQIAKIACEGFVENIEIR